MNTEFLKSLQFTHELLISGQFTIDVEVHPYFGVMQFIVKRDGGIVGTAPTLIDALEMIE